MAWEAGTIPGRGVLRCAAEYYAELGVMPPPLYLHK